MSTSRKQQMVQPENPQVSFGFHAIRHLTASILYRMGQPVSVIQAILRHKSPNTTAIYLTSLGLEETRGALEGLAARFAGKGHTPTPGAGMGSAPKAEVGNGSENGLQQIAVDRTPQNTGKILAFKDDIPALRPANPTLQAPQGADKMIIRRKRTA